MLLVILLAGTNYFFYTAIDNAMTHNYLFTVAALIIYLSIKWHQNQRIQYALLLGLFIGLAIVIRPTEILWCLIPLLWTIQDFDSVKQKFQVVSQNPGQLLGLILCVLGVGLLQMIYWKAASGKFIYYSYDGFFDFLDPHIRLGLFSLRKGWLVYTPVMTLALMGIPLLWWKNRDLFWVCFTYTTIVIYITFSWHAWSYGGSFGARPMVETYALMLFPMGAFLNTAFRSAFLKYALLVFIGFCIFLNCFQTWQYLHGFISHDGPDDYSYKVMFLKTHWNRPMIRSFFKLEEPSGRVSDSLSIYPRTATVLNDSANVPQGNLKISDAVGQILFDSAIVSQNHTYLRIDGKAMFEPVVDFETDFVGMEVTVSSQTKKGVKKEYKMPLQPLIGNARIGWVRDLKGVPGVWDDVFMYVPVPPNDSLQVQIAIKNPVGNNLYFNNLRVSLLQVPANNN